MEALLCTPANRVELLYGKWVAVGVVAGTSVLFQLAGLLFAVAFLIPSDIFGMPTLSIWSMASLLLSVLLFAVFVVAVELALAVRAHSVKEAGTVLGPIVIAFIVPAMFAQFVNLEGIEWWWFVAPIFNVCLAMREALLNITDLSHIALWLGSSLFYAFVAVTWAARQFEREDLVESIS
jgi:sodium transport system permease protein